MKCSNCSYEQVPEFKHCPECGSKAVADEPKTKGKKLLEDVESLKKDVSDLKEKLNKKNDWWE